MTILIEGNLVYSFPDTWHVTQYDDWAFYRNRFVNSCGGNKAVDFLAYNPDDGTLWLVELKDYRQHRRTKDDKLSLWDEVAIKARDTLAGLFAAKVGANDNDNQLYAIRSLQATRLRVVLHLEQPRNHSKIFPRDYNPADIQQKLRQILKPIDAHPRVVELNNMDGIPWNANSHP